MRGGGGEYARGLSTGGGGKKTQEKLLPGEQRRVCLGQAKEDLSGCADPGFNSSAGPKNGSCLLSLPSAGDESLQRRMTANQRSFAGLGSAHALLLRSHVGPCVAGAVLVAKREVYKQRCRRGLQPRRAFGGQRRYHKHMLLLLLSFRRCLFATGT